MPYPRRQRETTRRRPDKKGDKPQKPKDLGNKTSDVKLPSKKAWRPKGQGDGTNMTLHITVEKEEAQPEDAIDAPPGLEEHVKATVDELKGN
ncbi:hypothetical protein LIER_11572 [Lithospermum erythrorhizon]|uniref:Uncharacterized protein n=1 Tax=Lithospermum erythrorhizon TaxID=34254 RepID=A0AAV3PQ50_LITER